MSVNKKKLQNINFYDNGLCIPKSNQKITFCKNKFSSQVGIFCKEMIYYKLVSINATSNGQVYC